MKAEFEEKVYESWFTTTLAKEYPIYFAPGQVCENKLGFDASFNILSSEFNNFPIKQSWVLRELGKLLNLSKKLPDIQVNCFFQYKRPDEISTQNGKEWEYWNESYFRYEIYQEQQGILEDLYTFLNEEALILYASPKTIKIYELYDFYCQGKIIEESNFTEAIRLKGHHVNTYTRQSNGNQAFSEPEYIKGYTFNEHIELTISKNAQQEHNDFISNAIKVANTINLVMDNNERYSKIFSGIVENSYRELEDSNIENDFLIPFNKKESLELLRSLNIMFQFRLLTGIQWGCYFSK